MEGGISIAYARMFFFFIINLAKEISQKVDLNSRHTLVLDILFDKIFNIFYISVRSHRNLTG